MMAATVLSGWRWRMAAIGGGCIVFNPNRLLIPTHATLNEPPRRGKAFVTEGLVPSQTTAVEVDARALLRAAAMCQS